MAYICKKEKNVFSLPASGRAVVKKGGRGLARFSGLRGGWGKRGGDAFEGG